MGQYQAGLATLNRLVGGMLTLCALSPPPPPLPSTPPGRLVRQARRRVAVRVLTTSDVEVTTSLLPYGGANGVQSGPLLAALVSAQTGATGTWTCRHMPCSLRMGDAPVCRHMPCSLRMGDAPVCRHMPCSLRMGDAPVCVCALHWGLCASAHLIPLELA